MMSNRIICALAGALLNVALCFSGQTDSLRIDSLLRKSAYMSYHSESERLMFFAKSLIDVPYRGGTLDSGHEENLVVRIDSLDCTTYIETVLAMYLASLETGLRYESYVEALKKIRYRNGIIKGYASRLHYFSDWVYDNEKKGILNEMTWNGEYCTKVFSLNYMTTHSGFYNKLKNNDSLVVEMCKLEERWKDYKMPYIPKKLICSSQSELSVNDGDILALTTALPGLDVAHLGFAIWIDGRLHLLHASSLHGKVIIDPLPLYDYLKDRKKHTGIRVVRVK